MINFIIYETNDIYTKEIINIINKTMMQNDDYYRINHFAKYNSNFSNIINENNQSKIYILDMDVSEGNPLDIAKKIRQKDLESAIVFMTSNYDEYVKEILKGRFLFLSFIDKKNDGLEQLSKDIDSFLKIKHKKAILHFKTKNVTYSILTDNILCIISEKSNRHITIVTDYNEFSVKKTLIEMYKQLDDRFIYSHRSCLVNTERISMINSKTKEITFDNGKTIDFLSFRAVKEVRNKLQNLL